MPAQLEDGGVPPGDAGLVEKDAGVAPEVDGGGQTDAGSPPGQDAGTDGGSGPGPDGGSGNDGGSLPLPDAGVIRFIAVGDTGKGTAEQTAVGAGMATICNTWGCDFVALLGDNFYPSGVSSTSDSQWNTAFVQPYAGVNAPFYAVLGNHDYGGDGAGWEVNKAQAQVDYSLVNPKWRMPAMHYHWKVSNAHFLASDTTRSFFSDLVLSPLTRNIDQPVRADFASWLTASTSTWKIVFGHHPYISNGKHGNAGSYDGVPTLGSGVKKFLEDSVCGKVDFYICGHEHNRQWHQATCNGTEHIISGGGASTTALEAPTRNSTYFQSDASGFLYVVIDGRSFTGTFYSAAGVAQFTRTVTK